LCCWLFKQTPLSFTTMRLPVFGTALFLVALAVVQSHPNVRRRGQEEGESYGSDFSATESNPYSTSTEPAYDTDSTFGLSGKKAVLGNSGSNTIQKYSAPETVSASTQASNPDSVELSSNEAPTTGESNQAATTGKSNQAASFGNKGATTIESNQAATVVQSQEADATGEGNQAAATGEGNASAKQTNYANDQGDTGISAQTQDPSAYETNQSGTEGGTNTYTETQDTTTSGNPGETNQSGMEGEPAQVPAPAPTESSAGGNYQQGYQQGMPTAAQAPAPAPTETTGGGTYQQGNQETVVEERPGFGGGDSTPATSPTQDADSEAAVAAAPTPGPTVKYYASNNPENYEDPTGDAAKEESTETYEPPDDDPVDEGIDGEVENDWEDLTPAELAKKDLEEAEKDLDEALHDKYVPIVSAVCGVIALFFMIFVAQQMIENPDGCCAKVCRCSVACFRILCCPCRYICCCGGSRAKARRTHDLVSDNSSYGNGNYGYTHDLELT
jgi:hypothetical protein